LHRSPSDRTHAAQPSTARRPVVDTYHGVTVEDPYRWLENTADPEVDAWVRLQNAHTRAILDAWPGRDALRARVTELMMSGSVAYGGIRAAGGRLFAIKRQPPLEQLLLVVLANADDLGGERVVVDPNALDPAGKIAIDWYVPSLDGSMVAVSLSFAGTESGDVHIFDAATGRDLGDTVPRVNGGTAGGSLAWGAEDAGFYYTRYPRPGERAPGELGFHVHVYWHPLGADPLLDRYEIGREFPRIAEIRLESSRDGGCTLATVQKGDGGEFTHWLRDERGAWHALTRYEDRCVAARLGHDGTIYLVSLLDAPRGRVLRLAGDAAGQGIVAATVIVPEQAHAIEASFSHGKGLWTGDDRLYVLYQHGGPNVVKSFGLDGRPAGELPQPPLSAVDALVVLPGGDVLFETQTLTAPRTWYRMPRAGGPAPGVNPATATDGLAAQVEVSFVESSGKETPVRRLEKRTPAPLFPVASVQLEDARFAQFTTRMTAFAPLCVSWSAMAPTGDWRSRRSSRSLARAYKYRRAWPIRRPARWFASDPTSAPN
jgi:prolyl oligopeptidase